MYLLLTIETFYYPINEIRQQKLLLKTGQK